MSPWNVIAEELAKMDSLRASDRKIEVYYEHKTDGYICYIGGVRDCTLYSTKPMVLERYPRSKYILIPFEDVSIGDEI